MGQYCNDFLRRRDSLTGSCELRHEDDGEQTHAIQNIHWGDRDSGPDCHALQAPVCKLVRNVGKVTAKKERTDKQVGTKYPVVDVYTVSMVRLLSICRSWRMIFTRYCHDAHVSRGTGQRHDTASTREQGPTDTDLRR